MKRRLDALSGVEDWVLHDLRRTCVSGMARLRIAPHIADKILNHQSGTISGVVAVYRLRFFLSFRYSGHDERPEDALGMLGVLEGYELPRSTVDRIAWRQSENVRGCGPCFFQPP